MRYKIDSVLFFINVIVSNLKNIVEQANQVDQKAVDDFWKGSKLNAHKVRMAIVYEDYRDRDGEIINLFNTVLYATKDCHGDPILSRGVVVEFDPYSIVVIRDGAGNKETCFASNLVCQYECDDGLGSVHFRS